MPGIKKAEGPQKYNKVNQQKKYHLLNLFYKQKMPLREVNLFVLRQLKSQESTISQPKQSFSSTKIIINPISLTSKVPLLTSVKQKTFQLPFMPLLKKRIQFKKNFIIKSRESRSFVQSVMF